MPKKLLLGVLSLVVILSLLPTGCGAISNLTTIATKNVAVLGDNGIYAFIGAFSGYRYDIDVDLKPTKYAEANKTYVVDLYENGKLRASKNISFTQPEINVGSDKTVAFPATDEEYYAYWGKDISHIFSVKVHEPISTYTTNKTVINPNKTPSLTLTYPNGGEVWHVGDSVNITWASSNLTKDAEIQIYVSNDSGKTILVINTYVPNTGSYQWVVIKSYVNMPGYGAPSPNINTSYIGNHTRIYITCNSNDYNIKPSMSTSDFTIVQ
jgi:hypothetical protein